MGNWNSGRRPQPTALKVLRGVTRRRDLNQDEPKIPAPDFDAVPEDLQGDAVAVKEWERVVPLLRVSGIITKAEKPVLIALCQCWSQYCESQQKVRSLGMLVKGSDNVPIVNPYLKLARHSLAQCQRLWIELGLTPSSRSKLAALPVGEVEKLSRWGNDL